MAYSVREERQSLATSLREDLAEAERMIVQLRRDNVESFLQLLDGIEERFTQLKSTGLDLRTEQTRWGSLHSKLRREAGRVKRVLDVAGGLEQMRNANPPAQGMWWHLDAVVAAARRHFLRRLGMTIGTITALLGDRVGVAHVRLSAGPEHCDCVPSDLNVAATGFRRALGRSTGGHRSVPRATHAAGP